MRMPVEQGGGIVSEAGDAAAAVLAGLREVAHARLPRLDEAVMLLIADIATALVALIHAGILVLEMFLWTRPAGRRAFGLSREFAEQTRVLAANQGLYNGFLAAGLVYALALGAAGYGVRTFFLACVLVAGLYGAATASRAILFVQALPAAVALALVLAAR